MDNSGLSCLQLWQNLTASETNTHAHCGLNHPSKPSHPGPLSGKEWIIGILTIWFSLWITQTEKATSFTVHMLEPHQRESEENGCLVIVVMMWDQRASVIKAPLKTLIFTRPENTTDMLRWSIGCTPDVCTAELLTQQRCTVPSAHLRQPFIRTQNLKLLYKCK